jgi:pimeloyl-ACP methyl ester carboxylesterase
LNAPGATQSPTASPSPGKIAWTECGGFECGDLQVPLDYARPEGRKITLALIRKVATDRANRIGSLLLNPGGPGEPGIEFLRNDVQSLSHLNTRFDLISFDPRGVGQSTPITCVDAPTEDAYLAQDSVLDDPKEKADYIQSNKDFAAACQSKSGDLLPFMDSASVAKDMDQIRIAVGDAKLSYLGFSYGTNYGQWYAHLFPDKVRALSLDGVVDPTVPANDSQYGQIVGFEQNLQAFLADCRARSSCFYMRTGDPFTKLLALMNSLDKTPMRVGNREMTRSLAMTGVLATLYDKRYWQYLDLALYQVENGNGRLLLSFADQYNRRHSDGTYDNLFNGAFESQWCLDHPVPNDVADYDKLVPKYTAASALFGPWSVYSNLQCAYWPVKATYRQTPLTADGAPPILLVGGTNDPATPYSEAQAVHRVLKGSALLTRSGLGHTSYDSSTCSHTYEDDYLLNLTLPPEGTVCSG